MIKKKTPAEKRADTIRFQKEMMAMFDEFRRPKGKKQLLNEVQTLIYDAWESSPAQARKLARKALDLSMDCTDAYLLLAELEASTIRDQIALFRQAVEAGRRAFCSGSRRSPSACLSTSPSGMRRKRHPMPQQTCRDGRRAKALLNGWRGYGGV